MFNNVFFHKLFVNLLLIVHANDISRITIRNVALELADLSHHGLYIFCYRRPAFK